MQPCLLSNYSLVMRFFKSLILLVFRKTRTKTRERLIRQYVVLHHGPIVLGYVFCLVVLVLALTHHCCGGLAVLRGAHLSQYVCATSLYRTVMLYFATVGGWELVLMINYPITSIYGKPIISQISQVLVICLWRCLMMYLQWWQKVIWLP